MTVGTGPAPGDAFSDGGNPVASAGEFGLAQGGATDAGLPQVIVGEIPDADDPSHLLWTARCSFPAHGLLGRFEERSGAEAAKQRHLVSAHSPHVAPP